MPFTHRVTVTDLDGKVLSITKVDATAAGTDADNYRDLVTGEPLTDADKALLMAAPDVCPLDCDHCRAD